MEILGTVIAGQGTPSISDFSFVIKNSVKQGEFVSVKIDEGLLIGSVVNVYKTNKYFESAGTVSDLSQKGEIETNFPIGEWEYTIADVKILSVYSSSGMGRPNFPPAPGADVLELEAELLNRFLGLDQEKGICLGAVQQHTLPAKFNFTKLLQKHLAIIAMSGSGKSYATSVLIEELLNRKKEEGSVAVLIIDNHGEYAGFAEDPIFRDRVNLLKASEIKINLSFFNEHSFKSLLPGLSNTQVRELGKIIRSLKSEGKNYSLSELISKVEANEMKGNVKEPLVSWLVSLETMKIFSSAEFPDMDNLLFLGKAVIVDFSDVLNPMKKQLIVNYLSKRIFNLRREGKCPPYLEIIEEAHNFCPEGVKAEYALAKGTIETIAREGRKFYAGLCLISQRPIRLSTTALSQCNTQIILRLNNPYDLDHISKSFESISSQITKMISSLRVGEALILGEAVNYPVFVNIRERKSKELHGESLEQYSKRFGAETKKLASSDDFL